MCSDLHNLEKCLYRYNIAQKYNNFSEIQEEKANAEDIILKGGISNVRYIWRAENSEKTCDECSDLDGQEFDLSDDILPTPHPNCKCYIDVIANNTTENKLPVATAPTTKPTEKPTEKATNTTNLPGKWIMPCNGKITSPYGWRIHPTYGTKKFHDGIDIGISINTPLKAVASGKIVMAQWYNGYGKYIEIDHGNNIHSFYGHLNSYDVKVGDSVNLGQIIAKSGNSAGMDKNGKIMTTGPHLHFGIYQKGQSVNPLKFIKNF